MPTFIRDILDDTFHRLKSRTTNDALPGLSSGFDDFDAVTGGLHAGTLIVIAGRPSMGKTAFANSIVLNASMRNNLPTIVFSTETSKQELAKQLLLSKSGVNTNRLRINNMREDDWICIQNSVEALKEAPLLIDDSFELTSADIATKCRALQQELKQLKLVVVDSIQFVREYELPGECHNLRITARALKALALELSVPIVVLSPISCLSEERENRRPILSDCPIGNDADVIAFVYRDEYYDPESTARGEAEIIIARNKWGPTGTLMLRFDSATRLFHNICRNCPSPSA